MSRNGRQAQQGFTLLEILVVLLIIGLLVTMGVYTYISAIDRVRLRTDARAVNQALQLARIRAQATGLPHGIAFQRRTGDLTDRYWIFSDCGAQDGKYTDTNTEPNGPVASWEACASAAIDPRIASEPVFELQTDNRFDEIIGWHQAADADGAALEYVMFNVQGQAVRTGASGVIYSTGNVTVKREFDDGWYNAGVHVRSLTGMTSIVPMAKSP